MRGRTLTGTGKALIVAVVATVVLSILAPGAGLVAAIFLAVVCLVILGEGYVGGSSVDGLREEWAGAEAGRKREAAERRR